MVDREREQPESSGLTSSSRDGSTSLMGMKLADQSVGERDRIVAI
jgi:hypothetical protein